jgi:hypothetical protein
MHDAPATAPAATAAGVRMSPGTAPAPTFGTRRRGVLAFTCAVHLLALLLWTQERRPLPARPSRVVSLFLQTDGDRTARPPSRTDPHPRPRAVPSRPAAAHAKRLPKAEQPAEAGSDARAEAATSASDLVDTARPAATSPDARPGTPAPAGSTSSQGGFAVGLATHQAGRIDHELRQGKPGVPDEADTPWARFRRGLDAAHVDRTLAWQSDTYTSPDGVVIYRFRQGNRVRCRRSGGVGMPLRGFPEGGSATMASAGSAAETDCPKGVAWNRADP